MATDSTHLQPSDTRVETDGDAGMAGEAPGFASVQLAAATGDKPVHVDLPKGHEVIRIKVEPGQTIELPTDSTDGLLAKIGPEGNLAIVVDGRTIILQGYVEANEEKPIKIVTDDGGLIDPVELIAATDPSLDIQTAAGPAAGPQGNSDSNGSGIFIPFGPAGELGGLNAVGILGGTALQYKLIDDERKFFTHEEANGLPKSIIIVPDDGQPTAENGAFQLDEDFLPPHSPGGNKDLPQPSPGDDAGTDTASGTVVVDFGPDGPRAADPIVMSPIPNNTPSGLHALSGGSDPTVPGGEILLVLDAPAGGQQVLHGVLNGVEYFTITLDTTTGHFVVEQLEPLFHDDNHATEGNVFLDIDFSAFDSNGDSQSATLHLDFDDDMPEIL